MPEIILDPNSPYNGASYEDGVDSFIDKGVVASVYKGVIQDQGQQIEAALKIPHEEWGNKELDDEFNLLRKIEVKTKGGMFTPKVARGSLPGSSLKVLVMPFYKEQLMTVVRNHLSRGEFIQAEVQATNALWEFTAVVDAVHALEQTCLDRKIKDYYLHDARLVVIDWNVLNDLSAENVTNELAIFGRLWHEMFLQTQGQPPFNELDDARWQIVGQPVRDGGMVSLGLRYILAAMVNPFGQGFRSDGREEKADTAQTIADDEFPQVGQLRRVLEIWRGFLEVSPDMLPATGSAGLFEGIIGVTTPEAEAIVDDLRWRKLGGVSSGSAWEKRQAAIDVVMYSADESRQEIYDVIAGGNRRAAHDIVSRLMQKAKQDHDYIAQGHLSRWQLLTELSRFSAQMRKQESKLPDLFRALDSSYSQPLSPEVETGIQAIKNDLNSADRRGRHEIAALETVLSEIKLRNLAYDYTQNPSRDIQAKQDDLSQMAAFTEQVAYVYPVKNEPTLLGAFLDFDAEQMEVSRALNLEQTIQNSLDALSSALQNGEYRTVIALYREYLADILLSSHIKESGKIYFQIARFALWIQDGHPASLDTTLKMHQRVIENSNSDNVLREVAQKTVVQSLQAIYEKFSDAFQDDTSASREYEALQDALPYFEAIQTFRQENPNLFAECEKEIATQHLREFQQKETIYRRLLGFYDKWLDVARETEQASLSVDSTAITERQYLKQYIVAVKEHANTVTMYLDEAKELGVNTDEIREALLKLEHDGTTVRDVIEAGVESLLPRRTGQSLDRALDEITSTWSSNIEAAHQQHEVVKAQYEAMIQDYETKKAELDRKLTEFNQRQDGVNKLVDHVSELQTNFQTVKQQVGNIEQNQSRTDQTIQQHQQSFATVQADMTILHEQGARFLDVRKSFRNGDIASTRDALTNIYNWWSDNQTVKGSHLLREQLEQWNIYLKEYDAFTVSYKNAKGLLEQSNPQNSKRTNVRLLFKAIDALQNGLQNTSSFVFSVVYQDWRSLLEQCFHQLSVTDSEQSIRSDYQKQYNVLLQQGQEHAEQGKRV